MIFDALTWVLHGKISQKKLLTSRILHCLPHCLRSAGVPRGYYKHAEDWVLNCRCSWWFQGILSWRREERCKIMAESFDFTEEEIRRKLEQLGYSNIPSDKLKLFQRGLMSLLCRFNICWGFDLFYEWSMQNLNTLVTLFGFFWLYSLMHSVHARKYNQCDLSELCF